MQRPKQGTRFIACCCQLALLTLLLLHQAHLPALAGEQAEKALAHVRRYIDSGLVEKGAVLRLVVKQGNIHNFWGHDFELKNEWESKTGILLDANVMPQMAAYTYLKSNKNFDITIVRNREYPDLASDSLVAELTPFLEKFGFSIDRTGPDGFILPQAQTSFGRKILAIPADFDMSILYLRRDLLTDPVFRENYRKRFNTPLEIPQTWEEYIRQIGFFHRATPDLYGSCEQRDPETGWMLWMPRYVSQAVPDQYLFDDKMHPLIDSAAGVRATEAWLATIPFSPPAVLEPGNDYSYTLPFFKRGECFSYILTPAGAKIMNLESSPVRGKVLAAVMPGSRVDGRLVRRSNLIYGNNLVVASSSRQPELAFLYLMWLTDPDISARSVAVQSGFADPYRYSHLDHPAIRATYTDQVLQVIRDQIPLTTPAGTGLPGDTEYISALNRNLWRAGKREISAAEAMRQTAHEWERITDKLGRARQAGYWKVFKLAFPQLTSPID